MFQFRLSTALAIVAVTGVFCGLVFSAPLWLTVPILTMVIWVAPSLWISGMIYARNGWRAFFIGGIAAGWLPQAILHYTSGMFILGEFNNLTWWNGASKESASLGFRITGAVVFLTPGLISILGGITSYVVYRQFSLVRCKKSQIPTLAEDNNL